MEMPAMKRALCAWMIVAEFPSWFKADNEWKAELCRLCNLESTEDFELGWRDMVNKFELVRKGEPRKKYKKPRPKVRVGLLKKICQYFDVRIGREENEVIVVLGSRGDSFCLALRFLNSNWVQKPVSTHFQEKTWRIASIKKKKLLPGSNSTCKPCDAGEAQSRTAAKAEIGLKHKQL